MNQRVQRIRNEAAFVAASYKFTNSGKVEVDPDGGWVMIRDFPLPYGYNYDRTGVLILLPPGYPQTPPDWFYVREGLRRSNGSPPHYYENQISRAPTIKHWAAGCLHIRGNWHPTDDPLTGHSLLTVSQLIHDAFGRWLRQ